MMFTRAARTMLALTVLVACGSPAPTPPPQPSPEPAVVAPAPPRLVASTNRTCLMRERDTVCWGEHPANGEPNDRAPLAGWHRYATEGASQIQIGDTFLCALYPSGEVRCAREFESLRDRQHYTFSSPLGTRAQNTGLQSLAGLTDTIALAAGGSHVCALDRAGSVRCWGTLPHRVEGIELPVKWSVDLRPATVAEPEVLEPFSQSRALAASPTGTCVIHHDGSVHCLWLTRRKREQSEQRHPLSAKSIAMNDQAVCAVTANGTVSCFGPERKDSYPVNGLYDAISVVGAVNGFCARRRAGKVACWQVRYHEPEPFVVNVDLAVAGLSATEAIALGQDHLCALDGSNGVSCLGRNEFFQLAQPITTVRNMKVRTRIIPWLAGATVLFPNGYGLCTRSQGALQCLEPAGSLETYPERVKILMADVSVDEDGRLSHWTRPIGPPPRSPGALPALVMLGERREALPFRVAKLGGSTDAVLDKQGNWRVVVRGGGYAKMSAWTNVVAVTRGSEDNCLLMKDRSMRCYSDSLLASLDLDKSEPVLRNVIQADGDCGLTAERKIACYGTHRTTITGKDPNQASDDTDIMAELAEEEDDDEFLEDADDEDVDFRPRSKKEEASFEAIKGLPAGIVSFHGSSRGGCAVTAAHDVYCWLDGYRTQRVEELRGAVEAAQAGPTLPPLRCGRFPSGEVKCTGRGPALYIEANPLPVSIPEPLPAPIKIP